jgi:hypothetical protein
MGTRVLRETRGGRDEVLAMAVPGHERGTGLQSLEVPTVLYIIKFVAKGSKVPYDPMTCMTDAPWHPVVFVPAPTRFPDLRLGRRFLLGPNRHSRET